MYGCGGKYRGFSPNLVQLVRARGLEHLRPYSCKKISYIHPFLILECGIVQRADLQGENLQFCVD